MSTGTVRLHRVFKAPPERLYRAFIDGNAMVKWLPPDGFTGRILHLDPRVGGSYRMSFTNFSSGREHVFEGNFIEMEQGKRLVEPEIPDEG